MATVVTRVRPCPTRSRSSSTTGRSRSRTAAVRPTAWRTRWPRSATPSSSATGTSRPTCTPRRTACCWRSTTTPWTGSPTAAARWPGCPGPRCPRARIGGGEPIPLLEDLLGTWPDIRTQRGRQGGQRDRPAGAAACSAPARSTGSASPRSPTAGWPAAPGRPRAPAVHLAEHPRRGPAAGGGDAPGGAPAGSPGRPVRPGAGPGRPAAGRDARPGPAGPRPRPAGARLDRRRRQPR